MVLAAISLSLKPFLTNLPVRVLLLQTTSTRQSITSRNLASTSNGASIMTISFLVSFMIFLISLLSGGWMILFSLPSLFASLKTIAASFFLPAVPNSCNIFFLTRLFFAARIASLSASITRIFRFFNILATVVFPLPNVPVIPIISFRIV